MARKKDWNRQGPERHRRSKGLSPLNRKKRGGPTAGRKDFQTEGRKGRQKKKINVRVLGCSITELAKTAKSHQTQKGEKFCKVPRGKVKTKNLRPIN